jgi:hypothetical protein
MINKNSFFFVYLFVWVMCSSSCQQAFQTTDGPQIIEVDIHKDTIPKFEELFKEVRFVKLDINDENKIQKIDKLLITTDGKFIVVDKTANKLHGFTQTGEPLFSIDGKDAIQPLFNKINDAAYDREKNQLWVMDAESLALVSFTSDGKFVGKKNFEHMRSSGPNMFIAKDKILFDRGHYMIDSNNLAMFDLETLQPRGSYIPLFGMNLRWSNQSEGVFTEGGNTIYYIPPYGYTIYSIEGEKPQEMYRLDFKQQQPDSNLFLTGTFESQKEFHTYFTQHDLVERIYGLQSTNDHLFFSFLRFGGIQHHVFFNKATQKTITFFDVSGDYYKRIWSRNIIASTDNEFIGVIDEPELALNIAVTFKFFPIKEDFNPILAIYTMNN